MLLVTAGNTAAEAEVASNVPVAGTTFTLTTDADPVVGTSESDLITAAAGTLNNGDLISDAFSTDNDTLNVDLDEDDIAATISGIENINVNLDVFNGADATLDAANISGATITFASDKLGFDGEAEVDNAGDNNVTAGTNVDTLTVTGLEAGVVNTGSADTAAVTTAAATDAANVTVNGDVDLTVTTATDVAITGTAASTVTLTAAAATDVTVSGDVTLEVTAAQVDGDDVTGAAAVVVGTAASTDLTGVDSAITLDDDFAGTTVTTADNASVTFAEAQTGTVTIEGDATNDTNSVALTTGSDVATLDVSDDGLETTIAVTAEVTVADLTATGEDVILTGSDDVEVTTSDADSFDASGFSGELTYTSTVGATLLGGSGDNNITIANADTSYIGQGGVDTVDAEALGANTLAAQLGGGDDVLQLDTPTDTVAVEFGAGTDTVQLVDAADLSGATIAFTGLEAIEVAENNGSDVTANIDASTLSGQSYAVSSDDTNESGDVLNLTVTVDQATVDLGNLSLTNVGSVTVDASAETAAATITGTTAADTITGTATADTINGGAEDDTIIGNGGADALTGGAGADTFVFATGDTDADNIATISDFSIADFDVLNNVSGTVGNDTADTDVAAAITDGAGTEDVTADVVNGILTVSGDDAAAIDTLAEWVAVATTAGVLTDGTDTSATIAFEFNGNTYVYEETAAGAVDNLVELTGVTGVAALGTAAGVDTLVIS